MQVFGYSIGEVMREIHRQLEAQTNRNRLCMFPIKDIELFNATEKQQDVSWNHKIHKYENDLRDYESLPKPIASVPDYINAQFANGDGIVISNITNRLQLTAVEPEEIIWYSTQAGSEVVHTIAYNLMINALIKDEDKKNKLFNAVKTIPAIKAISDWMQDYTFADCPRSEVLVAFACAEGLLFPASFVPIFYFRIKSKMQVMVDVNKDISRDESLHANVAATLINRTDISKQRIREIVLEFSKLLFDYIDEMFEPVVNAQPHELIGTDGTDYSDFRKEEMILFSKYNIDSLLGKLGCTYEFNVKGEEMPTWIHTIACEHRNNFHERTNTNYRQSSTETERDEIDYSNC